MSNNVTLEINGKTAFTSKELDYGAAAGTYKVDDKTTMNGIMISGVEFTPANGGPAKRVTLTKSENAKGFTYTVTDTDGKELGHVPSGAYDAAVKSGISSAPGHPEAVPEPVAHRAASAANGLLGGAFTGAGHNGAIIGAASYVAEKHPPKERQTLSC